MAHFTKLGGPEIRSATFRLEINRQSLFVGMARTDDPLRCFKAWWPAASSGSFALASKNR